jgi:hypothetical protein
LKAAEIIRRDFGTKRKQSISEAEHWRDFDGDGKPRDVLTGPLYIPDTAAVQ